MNQSKEEKEAFIEAFITTIGGVDEDAVGCWVRGCFRLALQASRDFR